MSMMPKISLNDDANDADDSNDYSRWITFIPRHLSNGFSGQESGAVKS